MDYRELSNLAANPARVRGTAAMIKALLAERITDWQMEFLSKMERFEGPDRLSTRQCETLVSLRDQAFRRSKVAGYSAARLVRLLFEARLDLSEKDEEFVVELHEQGESVALSNPEWRYVFALCRELHIIDDAYISLN